MAEYYVIKREKCEKCGAGVAPGAGITVGCTLHVEGFIETRIPLSEVLEQVLWNQTVPRPGETAFVADKLKNVRLEE